jgi:hypothetical protein
VVNVLKQVANTSKMDELGIACNSNANDIQARANRATLEARSEMGG